MCGRESSEREETGIAAHAEHAARGGDGTYLSKYSRDGADVIDITDFGSAQGPTRFGVVSRAGAPRAGRKVALKPTRPIRPAVYKPRCSLYSDILSSDMEDYSELHLSMLTLSRMK